MRVPQSRKTVEAWGVNAELHKLISDLHSPLRIFLNIFFGKLGNIPVNIIADLFQVAAFQLGEDLHQQQVIYFVVGIS